ncbi:probable disease resistance protein At4g27220 [Neltuma alba]|uniref:probable disease resistance protein At4g27220 n=1 Tax=Neltuma alba TaxID=207710 RepID=UPI0010A2CCFB|nr:probable disease resistance protein At4g27220 [Prosopis alba]
MAEIAASSAAATKCTDILVDKVTKELPYLCCYKSYAAEFEERKGELSAGVESVDMKIKEAKRRNETQIDPLVKHWVRKANNFIQQETRPKKWFGFCNDWFLQYSLAKKLERIMQEIPTIMEKAENFSQVAHAAGPPGMEFYSQEFMHFKSRNLVYEQLREELKNDNIHRIGLQAMGGSGKTTMTKAIGKELENSKAFDKVVFIEVPNPVDEKKIQDEIAKKLELKLEDGKDLTHAEQIWIRITNAGSVFIILDDVWEELKLENIGIHHGIHTQGRCCVLLTTRYETICRRMGCQKTVKLGLLPEEDAVNLFLHHATENGKDCPNKLKLLASKVVIECGNLPVVIVAVARTFRNWDPNEWEDAFAVIEKYSSLRHGNTDEEVKKFYNSLKISFKCLDRGAQDLILLCSIFPRAYEIPVEVLSRIAIGSGLSENVGSYYRARSEVLSIKTTLVRSALLLTTRERFVKMHDVIRDIAHQIGDEKIQVIMDSKSKLKENVKYSSWMIDDFSNSFEGINLEVLLVWVNNASHSLGVPEAFFGGMKGLRVLLLCSKVKFWRTLALSLPKSIHSLENIQTLSLTNWELGDISILQNLKKLQTLELTNCSISELPNEVSQQEKLRLLGLVDCSIEKIPFEVIGRCSKLEVLYYISNHDTLKINPKPSKIIDLHQEFRIYHVEGNYSYQRSFQLDASTKRYFNSTKLKGILSESTIKSLAARAEILELTECNDTRWTNLIPDIVDPQEDEGMNGLIRLSLKSWPAIQCLINTSGIQSHATIFSNLVEVQLSNMCVRELCHGDFPNDFLKQLEKLYISGCAEIDGTLLKGKLELSSLKSIELNGYSITYLFCLSTAQSLKQLEKLDISGCSKMKCLISDDKRSAEQKVDDHHDCNQKTHHSMFSKLRSLNIEECHELEFILPIPCKELESVKIRGCNKLEFIFRQCLEEGGMRQMEKETILPSLQEIEIANVSKFINIYPEYYLPQSSEVQKSWGPLCRLSSKASAFSINELSFSRANQLNLT